MKYYCVNTKNPYGVEVVVSHQLGSHEAKRWSYLHDLHKTGRRPHPFQSREDANNFLGSRQDGKEDDIVVDQDRLDLMMMITEMS